MAAAVTLRDVVGVAQHVLVVAVVPLQGERNLDLVALARDRDRRVVQRGLGAVEIGDEGLDAALVVQRHLDRQDRAQVAQRDRDARIQEGQLAQAVLERREVELGLREDHRGRQELDPRAGARAGVADDRERRHGIAVGKRHGVFLAGAPDGEFKLRRQSVDDRDADAVQAARDLVGVLVELTAGVKLGHDHFGGRDAFFLVNVGRDAAAVVFDGDRAVAVEYHLDRVAMAGQRLVDRIVDDLADHMVQTRAVVGVADVHAGPFAHRVETAQDGDLLCAVLAVALGRLVLAAVAHRFARVMSNQP